jgi:hypothetical protein
LLTGSFQHWQDLGERYLVGAALWQNHCHSDVAGSAGIIDIAHDLRNIYNTAIKRRSVDDDGILPTALCPCSYFWQMSTNSKTQQKGKEKGEVLWAVKRRGSSEMWRN